ncbi:MAG: hypothetical protein M1830_002020 [Pleopsidium flavum]|nr:MAG: hypothetical protein M1830_002020 [Pleopsidium flavum]
MRFAWQNVRSSAAPDVFTFTAGATPAHRLSFSSTSSPESTKPPLGHRRPKRSRPLTDIDGEGSEHVRKKKRRLRLDLITSRLSRPYSAPPSHIISRGTSKIALWAKQKALGRNLLRKAAIMNRVRQRVVAAKEVEQRRMELARQAFLYDDRSADLYTLADGRRRYQSPSDHVPHRHYIPLPPSPLGLSNYDAFDDEDYPHSDGEHEEAEDQSVHSDFNILEPSESVIDDYDSLGTFESDSTERRPPTPPCEKVVELMMERERQKEVSFVQFEV